jgi:hypothetical protein
MDLSYVAVVMPMLLFPVRYTPTDESTTLAADVAAAIDATMPRKLAAQLMGVSEANLSHQCSGRKPLNLLRLVDLPPEFWHAFLRRIASRLGGLYVEPAMVMLLNGAAKLKKPMAKIAAESAERKVS